MNRFVILTCFAFFIVAPVQANEPERARSNLNSIENQLSEQKLKSERTARDAEKAETALEDTQKKLAAVGQKTKDIEQSLFETEQAIETLNSEKTTLTQRLAQEKKHMANMTLALQRLSRTPPQALIAKPNAPIDSARSDLILRGTLPALQQKSALIGQMMTRMQRLEQDLSTRNADLKTQHTALAHEYDILQKLVKERQTLYKKLNTEHSKTEKTLAKLSEEASSLKDLIAKIEAEEAKIRALGVPSAKPIPTAQTALMKPPAVPFASPKLDPKDIQTSGLPVAGAIKTGFNQKNEHGVTNKGIDITGRPGSTVIAPLGGVVKFAGAFKSYRNIVIIEHQDGTLGLIGGLKEISVQSGTSIRAGEPVGILGGHGGDATALYYEIRKGGEPIDPVRHLARFSKRV